MRKNTRATLFVWREACQHLQPTGDRMVSALPTESQRYRENESITISYAGTYLQTYHIHMMIHERFIICRLCYLDFISQQVGTPASSGTPNERRYLFI